jgi:hypothetical protein
VSRFVLRDLKRAFDRACLRIRAEYEVRAIVADCEPIHENSREWCAVLLHSEWSNFCRSLILASASCEPEVGGAVVGRVHNLRSQQDAAQWVTKALGLRYEPRWGSAGEALRAASALGVGNLTQVSGALGATNSPANDLRILRNFIAHRNRSTALDFRVVWAAHGGAGPMRADALLSLIVPAGESVFDSWLAQLRLISQAAAI